VAFVAVTVNVVLAEIVAPFVFVEPVLSVPVNVVAGDADHV
jgi:hypothetical protein